MVVSEAEFLWEQRLRSFSYRMGTIASGLGIMNLVGRLTQDGAPYTVDSASIQTMLNVPTIGGAAVAALLAILNFRKADQVMFSTVDQNNPEDISRLYRNI